MSKIVFVVFFAVSLFANFVKVDKDFIIKYEFVKSGKLKGELLIIKDGNKLDSKYLNISKSDKIPFFAKKKIFSYKIVGDKLIFDTLNNDNEKKYFSYDLKNVDSDILDMIGMSSVDIAKSSIIFNSDDEPEYSINKKQVFSVEALLLALSTSTVDINDYFYLYEPAKNILFKVQLKHIGDKTIKVVDKDVSTKVYQLRVLNSKKRLLNIYITSNKVPVRIESTKKRWSFDLIGLGEQRVFKYDYLDILTRKATKKLKKDIRSYDDLEDYSVDVISHDTTKTKHLFMFDINSQLKGLSDYDEYIDENYLLKKAPLSEGYKKVSLDAIIRTLEENYNMEYIEDGEFYKKKSKYYSLQELNEQYASSHDGCEVKVGAVYCADDTEPVEISDDEYKEIIEKDLNKEVGDISIEDMVTVEYKEKVQYTLQDFKDLVVGNFGLDSTKYILFDNEEGVFYIALNYDKINRVRCKNFASFIDARKYSSDGRSCNVSNVVKTLDIKKEYRAIKEYLYEQRPDLRWEGIDIEYVNNHTVKYKTVYGIEGLDDE